MSALEIDSVDRQLLALLRTDARTSAALLAKKLSVSRGTVKHRIVRMKRIGVLVGFTIKLRPDSQPDEIKAWVSVAVEGDKTRDVVQALLGEPALTSNGRGCSQPATGAANNWPAPL
jgi:DNA-binding Lrp family transcriptional regulator